MTIMRSYGQHTACCDSCGAELSEHDEFQDAVNEAKREGWKIRNEGGTWTHFCPDCDEPPKRTFRRN